MNATEFKTGLKQVKDQLRGLTLKLNSKKGSVPFHSLKEFGLAVLKEEAQGFCFSINLVWTDNGTKHPANFKELAQLLRTGAVTGISFTSYYESRSFSDYLTNDFGTNV